MNKKIKAIIKRTDEDYGHMTNISNTLENMQRTVGGYIEAITYGESFGFPRFTVICNEEGRIREIPYNCCIGGNLLFGDIIIVGVDSDEITDCPLTFQQWKKILDSQ